MPVDPHIALSGRLPKFENALDTYSRVAALQNAALQRQATQQQLQVGQQQLQAGRMQLQQQEQDQQDRQTWSQAYTEANGDPDRTRQLAVQRGVSAKSIQAFDAWATEQKGKQLLMKERATTLE